MTDRIIELLKKNRIDTYCINEIVKESAELFYIKKNLDLSRGKSVREVRLTVYRDMEETDGRKRGQSDVFIYPGMSDDEISELIISAYESAKYVKNPYFDLPAGEKNTDMLSNISLIESAKKMAEALYSVDKYEDAYINSSEFFATSNTVRTVTTAGCDVTYVKYVIKGEFVVQCKNDTSDVEFYQDFEYDDLQTEELAHKCSDALLIVRDRTKAIKAPDLSGYPVILYGKTVGELLQFYTARSNAAYIYPKYSPFCKGYKVQENVQGEKLNITFEPTSPYSSEGVRMKERMMLKDGVVQCIHGKAAHLQYLGSEQTGTYEKIKCDNGTVSIDDMMSEPYLLIKNFSDFQMDALDGQYGGEIRLAYLFDGKTTRIITGGSINGSIFDAEKNLLFSKERYKDAYYEGPLAVKL